jgi:16S rRNA (guanine966-N2)-methyltransferase
VSNERQGHKSGESTARAQHGRGAQTRQLRIIGGAWRGRRFRFPPLPGIRPTPDRVRETLFNWLANRVSGARCLDLFAGSGALGLEALSRGALEVIFIERDGTAVRELRARLTEWSASGARVEHRDALQFLRGPPPPQPFDIVFLDPPFAAQNGPAQRGLARSELGQDGLGSLLQSTLDRLDSRSWLSPGALLYIECPAHGGLPALPEGWQRVKAKQAGKVGYHLVTRSRDETGEGTVAE